VKICLSDTLKRGRRARHPDIRSHATIPKVRERVCHPAVRPASAEIWDYIERHADEFFTPDAGPF